MQWILQDFEDTQKLSVALDALGLPYTWHKVVPFSGDLIPEPEVTAPNAVVMFGSYSLWKHAQARGYTPGVFVIEPFLHETVWHPYLLNGQTATILTVQALVETLSDDEQLYFVRPVSDAKEIAGSVMTAAELLARARKVLAIDPEDIPIGSLRHDTEMMLTEPVNILQEWRLWVVDGRVVTYSLYKDRSGVVYRPEIDDDALAFGQQMADLNPGYATAYVLDVCRTEAGLHLLETNCLNAAGFYAADLEKLAVAIEALAP